MADEVSIFATVDGIYIYAMLPEGRQFVGSGLAGRNITAVIAREGVILAGSTDGIYRSNDLGRTWVEAARGLATRHIRWMAYDPQISDMEFAGTEPAEIYVSTDGGANWQSCPEVARLRDQLRWYLPYSPAAGCVRGFAFAGRRAYAAVEVGGVLIADDGGKTWKLAGGSLGDPRRSPAGTIHPDVHSILVHPSSADWVCAPTGGGFYISQDGGLTWDRRYDGYCRAAWADPHDRNHLLLGPASGVDRNGRIEETFDGGLSWQAIPAPQAPWPDHMVERFYADGAGLLAVLSNGEVLASPAPGSSGEWAWQRLGLDLPAVNAVTTMGA